METNTISQNNYNCSIINYKNISFKAMKKSQFKGIDLAVVEKFNTNNDLQNWAKSKTDNITHKEYTGRTFHSVVYRNGIIQEWIRYLNEKKDYTDTAKLLILDSLTKDLTPKTDTLPIGLNCTILGKTFKKLKDKLKTNPKESFNFCKLYKQELKNYYLKNEYNTGNQWVVIPSEFNNAENFKKNVEKFKTLSSKTWCTRNHCAKTELAMGDFHILLEKNKPKLVLRFLRDKLLEIQDNVIFADNNTTSVSNNNFFILDLLYL